MTPELTVLGLAALLQVVQIGLAGAGISRDAGLDWNMGPRDRQPQFSDQTKRLQRAVNNHFESLAFLTIAVLLLTVSGKAGGWTALAAWLHLGARVLYVPAYAYGWTPWRSYIWGVGFAAVIAMILRALF